MPFPAAITAQIVKAGSLLGVSYGAGRLVLHRGLRVNDSRKLVHFALFLLPVVLDRALGTAGSAAAGAMSAAVTLALLVCFTEAARTRVPAFEVAFASFDRPEDRPHTLFWLATQTVAGYAVIAPMLVLFHRAELMALVPIPILINGIGDGLAEPIGVRFGRHKYRVRAIGSDRVYTRSLEGSACVFLASVAILCAFAFALSPVQLAVALAVIPLAMTLAEAWSPHTWDTPILFLVGYVCLYAIAQLF